MMTTEERAAYNRQWREKNKDARREYRRKWERENKDKVAEYKRTQRAAYLTSVDVYLQDYKSQMGCACGVRRPELLDFHHRNPSEKEFQLSAAIQNCYSLERVKAEVNKCDVLCKLCHTLHHFYERQSD